MKTILVEIDVEGAPQAIKNINDLENAIGSLEDELKQAEFGSEEFKKLSRELTKAQQQLKNTELALESLDSEQVASEFGALTGAVGDLTGAFVLLGGEDSPVSEVGEKISTAIGISMAFKGAIEGISAGRKLLNNALATSNTLQKINNTVTVAATAIMGLFSKSVKATSLSFKVLKGAIMATGIGALVIGISSAISAIGDWISGTGDAEEAAEKFAAEIEETNRALDKQTKAFQNVGRELDRNLKLQVALAKAQGKSNKEIAKMEENTLKQKILNINKEIAATTKMYKLKLEQNKDAILMGFTEQQLRETNAKGMGDLFNKEAELQQQRKDLAADLAIMIKTNNANEIKEEKKKQEKITEEEKKASDKRKEERKKNKEQAEKDAKEQAEKELQRQREHEQNLADIRNEFLLELEEETEIYRQSFLTEQEIEIEAVQDKYFRLKELAIQHGEDTTQLELNEEKAKADIRKKFADEELANQRQLNDQKLTIASDALGAINGLVQAFAKEDEESARKAFNVNKAVGIAQAIISTAQGVINAYANPVDVASGVAFAKSAIIAATGAAQIAVISKTKFDSPEQAPAPAPSTGIGGGTGATTQPPAFNVVGQSGFNQIATALGQGQPPIQAFVVSQDVTTAQQLDNAIIQTATF
tara:strand:- start:156 stop:2099 length:1944 start_codon:yes stop_codon:yes gene_type:complete